MISDARVRMLARQDGVTAGLAEKNYVNSWILYAIYQSPLSDVLVFKGGTALSKLYFPRIWRFSEDLDFTATQRSPGIHRQLQTALEDTEVESGISFEITNIHEAGDPVEYIQVHVQYDAILGQRNTTKLDIDLDEQLAFPTVTHRHGFEDVPEFELTAYGIEEILVEKLRSLYQRARARDYYDIYQLLQQDTFNNREIADALRTKSTAAGLELDLDGEVPSDDVESVRNYWNQALDRLVQDKPPFNEVVERIQQYLRILAEQSS